MVATFRGAIDRSGRLAGAARRNGWSIALVALILCMICARSAAQPLGEGTARAPATPDTSSATSVPAEDEVKTMKERLSDKASDEQRIDNCHVAPDRRGPKQRPECSMPAAPPSVAGDGAAR